MNQSTSQQSTVFEELTGSASHVFRQAKKLVREGMARRLIVYDNEEERTMLDVPLAAGVAGTVLASYSVPIISAIALYLFGMNDVSIIVERKQSEEEQSNKNTTESRSIEIQDDNEDSENDSQH